MGLGYFLSEDVKHNKANGHLVTKNTWQYKPFVASDIPRKFKIYLLENTPNSAHGSVLRSKATGEPPLVCSSAVIFALKEAITSARKELECTNNFDFDIPLTVEKRHLACGIKDHHLNI
jgi:xanthine dehydrogenase/oxidase